MTELRTRLFFECRRWYNYGEQPDNEDTSYIRGLTELHADCVFLCRLRSIRIYIPYTIGVTSEVAS